MSTVKPKIHKNDVVTVITGKDRGKSGKVIKVLTKDGKAIVEKINFVKRHSRRTQKMPQGGILEKEAPIQISNLKLVCNKCNALISVRFTKLGDSNQYIRTCSECKEMIDK
jgi:large subunit ribosomal protein L24